MPLGKQMVREYHTHIHVEMTGTPPEDVDELIDVLQQVAPFIDGRLAVSSHLMAGHSYVSAHLDVQNGDAPWAATIWLDVASGLL